MLAVDVSANHLYVQGWHLGRTWHITFTSGGGGEEANEAARNGGPLDTADTGTVVIVPEPNQNMSTRDKQEIQHTETSTLDLSVCDVVTISSFMADSQSNRSNSFWEQIDIIVLVLWYAAEHNNTHHKYITEYSVCSRLHHIWPNRLTLL